MKIRKCRSKKERNEHGGVNRNGANLCFKYWRKRMDLKEFKAVNETDLTETQTVVEIKGDEATNTRLDGMMKAGRNLCFKW